MRRNRRENGLFGYFPIVKMDIEGMEYSVVSSLLLHGVLCRLDFLSVECVFARFVHATVKENRDICRLKEISSLDDETYVNDNV